MPSIRDHHLYDQSCRIHCTQIHRRPGRWCSRASPRIFSLLSASENYILSAMSREKYYLNEKTLDSVARELNQLTGTAKQLLCDWLEAA